MEGKPPREPNDAARHSPKERPLPHPPRRTDPPIGGEPLCLPDRQASEPPRALRRRGQEVRPPVSLRTDRSDSASSP
jgi:hypothetical protein